MRASERASARRGEYPSPPPTMRVGYRRPVLTWSWPPFSPIRPPSRSEGGKFAGWNPGRRPEPCEHHESLDGRRRRGDHAIRVRFVVRLERLSPAALGALRHGRHPRQPHLLRRGPRVRHLYVRRGLPAPARRSPRRGHRGWRALRARGLPERLRRRKPPAPVRYVRPRGRRRRRDGAYSPHRGAPAVVSGEAGARLRPGPGRLRPRHGGQRPPHLVSPLGDRRPVPDLRRPGALLRGPGRRGRVVRQAPVRGSRVRKTPTPGSRGRGRGPLAGARQRDRGRILRSRRGPEDVAVVRNLGHVP